MRYAVMLCVLCLSGSLSAQPRRPPRGPHGPPPHGPGPEQIAELADELGLSTKQKTAIRDLADEARKQQAKIRAEMEIAEIDLRRELEADEPDEAKVTAQIEKLSGLEASARKTHILAGLKIRKLLTKDQRAKLAAAQEQRRKEMRERHERLEDPFRDDGPPPPERKPGKPGKRPNGGEPGNKVPQGEVVDPLR